MRRIGQWLHRYYVVPLLAWLIRCPWLALLPVLGYLSLVLPASQWIAVFSGAVLAAGYLALARLLVPMVTRGGLDQRSPVLMVVVTPFASRSYVSHYSIDRDRIEPGVAVQSLLLVAEDIECRELRAAATVDGEPWRSGLG